MYALKRASPCVSAARRPHTTTTARFRACLYARTQLRASKALQDRVLGNARVTVHYNTEVVDIQGDDPDLPFTCVAASLALPFALRVHARREGGKEEGKRRQHASVCLSAVRAGKTTTTRSLPENSFHCSLYLDTPQQVARAEHQGQEGRRHHRGGPSLLPCV